MLRLPTTGLFSALVPMLVTMLVCSAGCRSHQRLPATRPLPQPVEMLKKPAIDLSRGGAGFPLATKQVPQTAEALQAALTAGYAERLTTPELVHVDVVSESPSDPGHVDVDISHAKVRTDYTPKQQKKEESPVATVRAGRLSYTAEPLNYQHFTAGMRMVALDARLGIIPAGDGTYGMSLVNCSTGRAFLRMSMEGLRDGLAKGVQVKQSVAFGIDSVTMDVTSDDPHALALDVLVRARLLLIPASFRIVGRAEVDEAFNVHFVGLNASGLDPTGRIIAGVVQSRLDKVNGKAAPLLKMPGDQIKVSDLTIAVGSDLTIDIGLVGTATAE